MYRLLTSTSYRLRLTVVIAVCSLVFGSALAYAATNAAFSACLTKTGGLYNVTVSPTLAKDCKTGDTPVTWNQSGPEGPQGPAGPEGPQGPAGVLGFYTATRSNVDYSPGTVGSIAAACEPGDKVTGGGFATFPGVQVTRSQPQTNDTEWLVTAVNTKATSTQVSVYAICADVTP